MTKGRIVHAISGFYDVAVAGGGIVRTKPRGIFRKKGQSPLVGDWVEVDETDEAVISQIYPRKNSLIRPPMANIDKGILVMSAKEPDFSPYLMDRFIVYLGEKRIEPILLLTKMDLLNREERKAMDQVLEGYCSLGYTVISNEGEAFASYLAQLSDEWLLLMGQSGVGKSTMLNRLLPELKLETGDISLVLNRGRHTTRSVTVYPYQEVFIADTPGFSSLQLPYMDKEDLGHYFIEWKDLSPLCKYQPCTHTHEPQCAVKEFCMENDFHHRRYEHYLKALEEVSQQKPHYERKR
ncbi:ribosome small subunit-dependent GTPase A [Atopobacter sp. AH10]|uniref:ribosome small subunit-dependent GTPase A n=1 Tax=Atopobacter sp. AH10 TaxID=2315861 RepID=UPI000EF25DB6|nr:ribosome small subunit-dependent GTPase A [Atopobacter sp. AH10]RLK64045.1 ribosome small subunit-dependent GTPase A [Atopobacter sp. AH10]